MSLDLIPAPVENFAVAHPGIVHGALVVGGVVLAGALIIGGARFAMRKLGVIS